MIPQAQEPLSIATASSLELSGTVSSIISPTEFRYQTGSPHGYVHVIYTTSMITPSGSTVSVGQTVSVTGAFDGNGQLVATGVTLESGTSLTLVGTVNSIISPTAFRYQTGNPHGYVYVVYSASVVTPSGSSVSLGQTVSVTGTFNSQAQLVATAVNIGASSPPPTATPRTSPSPSPTPTRTATPTPAPTGLYHIATLAYDDNNGPGENASATSVNQYLSYAQGNGKSASDCHSGSHSCKAVFYLDPNHSWNNSPSSCVYHPDADVVAAASESWFVHDLGYTDSAHRVYGKSASGCTIWEMNPNSSGLQSWWRNYLRANADNYDVYFADDDSMILLDEAYFHTGGGCNPWPSYCRSTQEMADDAGQVAAHANFVNAMTHSNGSPMYFSYQGASFNSGTDVSAFTATDRFIGLSCEGCVATTATPTRPNLYKTVLDEMAAVNNSSGAFLLISHGNSPAGSATQILQRLVTTGVVWLAYSEGHTIVQPDLESNTDNLAVWPEDLIYPSNPLQSMVTSSSDLQVTSGVWRREFAACYQQGRRFGACATVVNSTSSATSVQGTWLRQTYHHVITLSGGDALSGGTANVAGGSFVANSTTVPAGGVLLLTP